MASKKFQDNENAIAMRVFEIANAVRENNGGNPLEKFSETASLRKDFGFDSYALAELSVNIEEEFGVDVFYDGDVLTIREIAEKIPPK